MAYICHSNSAQQNQLILSKTMIPPIRTVTRHNIVNMITATKHFTDQFELASIILKLLRQPKFY